ncbi:MAG: hypothetical protein N4A47_05810 [Clostridia bacterium]|jgi:hypothetical protein|nr:hypothetical protein [Clostridia bacterium]
MKKVREIIKEQKRRKKLENQKQAISKIEAMVYEELGIEDEYKYDAYKNVMRLLGIDYKHGPALQRDIGIEFKRGNVLLGEKFNLHIREREVLLEHINNNVITSYISHSDGDLTFDAMKVMTSEMEDRFLILNNEDNTFLITVNDGIDYEMYSKLELSFETIKLISEKDSRNEIKEVLDGLDLGYAEVIGENKADEGVVFNLKGEEEIKIS